MKKKLGQGGSNATVYEMEYLNMAPMAYKLSKGGGVYDEDYNGSDGVWDGEDRGGDVYIEILSCLDDHSRFRFPAVTLN